MMLMFVALIAGATFAAILSGLVVQNIPFTVLLPRFTSICSRRCPARCRSSWASSPSILR